jgi:hypothetical protein
MCIMADAGGGISLGLWEILGGGSRFLDLILKAQQRCCNLAKMQAAVTVDAEIKLRKKQQLRLCWSMLSRVHHFGGGRKIAIPV